MIFPFTVIMPNYFHLSLCSIRPCHSGSALAPWPLLVALAKILFLQVPRWLAPSPPSGLAARITFLVNHLPIMLSKTGKERRKGGREGRKEREEKRKEEGKRERREGRREREKRRKKGREEGKEEKSPLLRTVTKPVLFSLSLSLLYLSS